MDFTFFVAAFIAVVVGFAFAFTNFGKPWKRLLIALLTAVCLDFALLIDWNAVNESATPLLLFDLVFFSIYGLVGCSIGLGIVSVIRDLIERLTRRD